MPANHVAENVLGTAGAILWSVQLFPQLWKSYSRKTTEGLHTGMMVLWAHASMVLGAYVIVKDVNIPLKIQPQSMGFLCALCAAQAYYYDRKTPLWKVSACLFGACAIAAGVEVGLVYGARELERQGKSEFTTFLGVLSLVLINAGFLPQIWTSWKLKEVFGISFIFLVIDSMGGIVSAISLAFSTSAFDILACISYIGPVFFECIIYSMALYYNPIARKKRRLAAEAAARGDPGSSVEHSEDEGDGEEEEGVIHETLEEKRLREAERSQAAKVVNRV